MKEQYEYDVVTSEDYYRKLKDKQKDGFEVYKTEVKTKEEKCFGFKSQKEIKVWHIRRNITPIKIKINTIIDVPKYCYDMKQVGGIQILGSMNDYMRKKGLLQ